MSNRETATERTGVLTMHSSWADIRSELDPGEVLHIERGALPHPNDIGMNRSHRTVHAITGRPVWRDDKPKGSLQIVEYADYFAARVTEYNPDDGVTKTLAHAAADDPVKTGLAAFVGLTVCHGVSDWTDSSETSESSFSR